MFSRLRTRHHLRIRFRSNLPPDPFDHPAIHAMSPRKRVDPPRYLWRSPA